MPTCCVLKIIGRLFTGSSNLMIKFFDAYKYWEGAVPKALSLRYRDNETAVEIR